MRTLAPCLAGALVWLVGAPASAQQAPLTVAIVAPLGGVEDTFGSTTSLEASVSDPTLLTATVTIHGASYEVPVEGGVVRQTLVVAPGVNRVGVMVRRGDEVATDSVTWFVRGEPTELLVLATWEAHGEIIDLWAREPDGETCKWDHRETASGGHLLDFSSDAIGFGSQAYVAPVVRPGTYRLKVHYWGNASEDDARYSWDYEELITRLDAAELALASSPGLAGALHRHQRDQLLRRLDEWAAPAAPQTTVRIEAILFPGTRHERRWRFERTIQRTGDLSTLGEVEIDAAMIRAARVDAEGR
jgi:hypothetical protein